MLNCINMNEQLTLCRKSLAYTYCCKYNVINIAFKFKIKEIVVIFIYCTKSLKSRRNF